MQGDYNKCQVNDFVYFYTEEPSFSWQNGIYMIVKKTKFPEVELFRIDQCSICDIEQQEYLCTHIGSIESEHCKLITKDYIYSKLI